MEIRWVNKDNLKVTLTVFLLKVLYYVVILDQAVKIQVIKALFNN